LNSANQGNHKKSTQQLEISVVIPAFNEEEAILPLLRLKLPHHSPARLQLDHRKRQMKLSRHQYYQPSLLM